MVPHRCLLLGSSSGWWPTRRGRERRLMRGRRQARSTRRCPWPLPLERGWRRRQQPLTHGTRRWRCRCSRRAEAWSCSSLTKSKTPGRGRAWGRGRHGSQPVSTEEARSLWRPRFPRRAQRRRGRGLDCISGGGRRTPPPRPSLASPWTQRSTGPNHVLAGP